MQNLSSQQHPVIGRSILGLHGPTSATEIGITCRQHVTATCSLAIHPSSESRSSQCAKISRLSRSFHRLIKSCSAEMLRLSSYKDIPNQVGIFNSLLYLVRRSRQRRIPASIWQSAWQTNIALVWFIMPERQTWWNPSSQMNPRGKKERLGTAVKRAAGHDRTILSPWSCSFTSDVPKK